jgi:hypothetical protein
VCDGRIISRAATVFGAAILATTSIVFIGFVLAATLFLRPLTFGDLPIAFVVPCGRSIS